MNQDPHFLRLEHITKAYDGHLAVNDVSFEIPRGKIFGLLGPNGAGKTTIIRMITGITAPDTGTIYFNGQPLTGRHSEEIGYMPEERGLYKKMKVREQIVYLLSLKGMSPRAAGEAADHWLERLGLTDWADSKTTDLSKGMQQKVQFISTIAHRPPLLILDEPFSGLDPVNSQLMEDEIRRLSEEGTTIIFSTHRMEQVEELCEYIALINQGKLMLCDEITTVRKRYQHNLYRIDFEGDRSVIEGLPGIKVERMNHGTAMVTLLEGHSSRQLMADLAQAAVETINFELHLPRLQEIFIELVGGRHDALKAAIGDSEPIAAEPETLNK